MATHSVVSRRVLILASYCDGDTPDCTDEFPCRECLSMNNVAIVTGRADVLGGLGYLRDGNPPDQCDGPSTPESLETENARLLGELAEREREVVDLAGAADQRDQMRDLAKMLAEALDAADNKWAPILSDDLSDDVNTALDAAKSAGLL